MPMDIQEVFLFDLYLMLIYLHAVRNNDIVSPFFSFSPLNLWEIIFIFYLRIVKKWNLF